MKARNRVDRKEKEQVIIIIFSRKHVESSSRGGMQGAPHGGERPRAGYYTFSRKYTEYRYFWVKPIRNILLKSLKRFPEYIICNVIK